eukprot:g3692.t1
MRVATRASAAVGLKSLQLPPIQDSKRDENKLKRKQTFLSFKGKKKKRKVNNRIVQLLKTVPISISEINMEDDEDEKMIGNEHILECIKEIQLQGAPVILFGLCNTFLSQKKNISLDAINFLTKVMIFIKNISRDCNCTIALKIIDKLIKESKSPKLSKNEKLIEALCNCIQVTCIAASSSETIERRNLFLNVALRFVEMTRKLSKSAEDLQYDKPKITVAINLISDASLIPKLDISLGEVLPSLDLIEILFSKRYDLFSWILQNSLSERKLDTFHSKKSKNSKKTKSSRSTSISTKLIQLFNLLITKVSDTVRMRRSFLSILSREHLNEIFLLLKVENFSYVEKKWKISSRNFASPYPPYTNNLSIGNTWRSPHYISKG